MSNDLGLGPAAGALLAAQPRRGPGSHVAVPSRGVPRLLVPRSPGRAAAVSLARYTVPASRRSRLLLAGASSLARVGALRVAPGGVHLGGPDTFVAHLAQLLGRTDLAVAVHLGPVRANRKPVLHVMDRTGRSVAYAKLGVDTLTCRRVRQEAEALRLLTDRPTPGLISPALIDSGTWAGLDYLVMKPLPWSADSVGSGEERRRAKASLAAAFPSQDVALRDAPWLAEALTALAAGPRSEDSRRLQAAAARLLTQHGGTSMRLGAGHGDWSQWNMGLGPSGMAVWDWERFATTVPVDWDELHFAIGAAPAGQAAVRSDVDSLLRAARESGADDPQLILATYLLHRGVYYVVDGQRHSGTGPGSLRSWVLPALEALVPEGATA